MAMPVPVVSMMYFLVSTPPKTFVIVSPAFSPISVKLAMGVFAPSKAAGSHAARAKAPASTRNPAEPMINRPTMELLDSGVRQFIKFLLAQGLSLSCFAQAFAIPVARSHPTDRPPCLAVPRLKSPHTVRRAWHLLHADKP